VKVDILFEVFGDDRAMPRDRALQRAADDRPIRVRFEPVGARRHAQEADVVFGKLVADLQVVPGGELAMVARRAGEFLRAERLLGIAQHYLGAADRGDHCGVFFGKQ
jgi:hypothetical protein